ncbi:MAG TPA: secretin N-terminal domain-containing protein [Pirellulaceae bacterium]|nr:secretin N-terminal domain-containing protein [Pirellulaceae bacterium]
MQTSPLRAAIVGLLTLALAGPFIHGPAALAQNGAGPIIRPYSVQNKRPEEAAELLRKRAAGLPETIEVSVDPATGTLLVRGSAAAQTFLAETLKQFDQPPASAAGPMPPAGATPNGAAPPPPKILPYVLTQQDLPRAVELVESLAAGREDVRFTVDARTSQLLVSAPAEFHQTLAQRIDALAPPGTGEVVGARTVEGAVIPPGMNFPPAYNVPAAHTAPAQGDFVPAGNVATQNAPSGNTGGSHPPLAPNAAAQNPAARNMAPATNPQAATPGAQMAGRTLRLQHITIDSLASLIRDQWGTTLPTARDEQGGKTVIKMGGPQESPGWILLDHVGGTVSIQGTAPAVAAWEKVVQGLDVPNSNQQASTLLRVERADPDQVRQAVSFLGNAGAGDVAAALPTGAAPQTRLVAQAQPGANQPSGVQPGAVPPRQPQPTPGGEIPRFGADGQVAPGDAAQNFAEASGEAGTIGPVRIEFVEGLDVIIIRGNPSDVARVTKLIQELDRLSETTQPRVEVQLLRNVSSEPLAALVTEVYDQILSPRQGQVVIRPLGKPNAILMIGRAESVEVVKQLIEQLDQPVIPAASFRVFRLKHMSAVDADGRLEAFYEERGGLGVTVRIVADYRSNSVIVQAGPRDMLEIAQLLESIDVVEAGALEEVRYFRLTNAIATNLAPILQNVLNGQLNGAGQSFAPAQGGQQTITQQPLQAATGGASETSALLATRMLSFLQVSPDGTRMLRSGLTLSVRVTADANSNTLVVTGPSESMDLVASLVDALDQLPNVEAQVKVFTIVNGDAESLVATLDSLFGTSSGAGGAGGGGGFGQTGQSGLNQFGAAAALASGATEGTVAPLRFAVDPRSNSIIASGSPGSLGIVERVLIRLDETGDEQRRTTVYRLNNSPAEDVAEAINEWIEQRQELVTNDPRFPVIQQIERQLIVVPETVTNSLIVSATARFYDDIVALIEQLDSQPPMINIQVLIAEVQLSDFEEFGIELGLQDSLLINNPLGGTQSGRLFNDTEPLLGNGGSGFGVGTTSATAGYPGLVLSAGNESISLLLRTLQDQQRLQVLSKPQISTLDNQEAFVQVGQRVPRVTNISQNTGGGVTSSTELDDLGILLGVRPRTSPEGLVVMQVNIERSSVGPASQGIPIFVGDDGTTINSPIYNVTSAETTVSARSGQTVIISGLITKSNSIVSRKIPYLSDVPVLGRLFRYDLRDDDRSELMIVMTPYIMSRREEADAIRDMESERMNWCIADVVELIGESGLQSRMGWTGAQPTVVYPQRDPTGQQGLDPAFEAVIRERLDAAACEPGMDGLPLGVEGYGPGAGGYAPGAEGYIAGPEGYPLGAGGYVPGAEGDPPGFQGGPQGGIGPVGPGGPGGPGMQAPGGIPNGPGGQRMYPYEVPAVAPKPTPFDQVNPNISRIPQSYRDDPFFTQRGRNASANPRAPAPAAPGVNPPPVYVAPPEGSSILLPPGTSPGAPLPLQPGAVAPPQPNLLPPGTAPRNVPTPAPGRPGYPAPPTGGPTEEVLDPPPKLDSPEPSDPRSIYGPMSSTPRQTPPMQRPPYGQHAPGQYPPSGQPQRLPHGVAPASYGSAGPNGGQYVPNGPAPQGTEPQRLPPQYVGGEIR